MSVNDQDAAAAPETGAPLFDAPDWWIYCGTGRPIHDIDLTETLPTPWRDCTAAPARSGRAAAGRR